MMNLLQKNKVLFTEVWKKYKDPVSDFLKAKEKTILMFFCEILSVCVASYFFLPFIITDTIQQNLYFAPWYLIGIGVTCFGIFGIIYSFFQFNREQKKKDRIKIICKAAGIYIVARMLMALAAGGMAVVFAMRDFDVEIIKSFIDRSVQIGMGPINAFIILYIAKLLYELPWKHIRENILLMTILCYITNFISFLLQLIGSSMIALVIQTVVVACMITGVLLCSLFMAQLKVEE